MKLYYDKRLKDPTYYIQYGFRNANGKSTTKNVKKIGKYSELLKITDDPIAYAKEQVALMNASDDGKKKAQCTLDIDFNEKVSECTDDASHSEERNIGYFFLQYIYQKLMLDSFFDKYAGDRKTSFNCNEVNRFLTYSRIMDPCSKLKACEQMRSWYEMPQIETQHVYRFMDILYEHRSEYLSWLYKKSNNVVPRDMSVVYYDCTNYYFETERPDEEYIDEITGEIMRGLREFGISKENRPNPIVEMGLLMDKHGIPISMCLEPGNTSEQITAVPLEKEVIKSTGKSDLIYCADAGLGSFNIRQFNAMGGRHFIVTQSVKKLSAQLKEAVFNDYDYKLLSDDKPVKIADMKSFDRKDPGNLHLYNDRAYKIINADKAVDLGLYEYVQQKNGKTVKRKAKAELKQIVIVTFSRKMMEYQRSVRSRQIERAKKTLNNAADPEEIKKGTNDVKRFLKRVAKTKSGEKADVTYELDLEKIAEEEKYDGYYAIATNMNSPVKEILAISGKRYQIEDCFRIMKTNMDARPVFHYRPDRIVTHFLICYTALLVYRLLEYKMKEKTGKGENYISINSLVTTLCNMNVTDINDQVWKALYSDSRALSILVQTTGLPLDMKYYWPSDLNKMIRKIRK